MTEAENQRAGGVRRTRPFSLALLALKTDEGAGSHGTRVPRVLEKARKQILQKESQARPCRRLGCSPARSTSGL